MTDIIEVRRGKLTGRMFTTAREAMAAIDALHRARTGCAGTDAGHTCVQGPPERPRWYQQRDDVDAAHVDVEAPRAAETAQDEIPW